MPYYNTTQESNIHVSDEVYLWDFSNYTEKGCDEKGAKFSYYYIKSVSQWDDKCYETYQCSIKFVDLVIGKREAYGTLFPKLEPIESSIFIDRDIDRHIFKSFNLINDNIKLEHHVNENPLVYGGAFITAQTMESLSNRLPDLYRIKDTEVNLNIADLMPASSYLSSDENRLEILQY